MLDWIPNRDIQEEVIPLSAKPTHTETHRNREKHTHLHHFPSFVVKADWSLFHSLNCSFVSLLWLYFSSSYSNTHHHTRINVHTSVIFPYNSSLSLSPHYFPLSLLNLLCIPLSLSFFPTHIFIFLLQYSFAGARFGCKTKKKTRGFIQQPAGSLQHWAKWRKAALWLPEGDPLIHPSMAEYSADKRQENHCPTKHPPTHPNRHTVENIMFQAKNRFHKRNF